MNNKIIYLSSKYYQFFLLLIISAIGNLYSQTQPIGVPTYEFTRLCASDVLSPTPTVKFTFTPGSFNSGNTFILELSDPLGNFTNLTPISIVSSNFNVNPGIFTFKVPNTVSGNGYKLRVRSTSPALISNSSNAFTAIYVTFNNSFYINGRQSEASLCNGSSLILSVDPEELPNFPSPIIYPNLKYNWYKDNSNIPIGGQNKSSITINSAGTYYAEIDYGVCQPSNGFGSNRVKVTTVSSGQTFTITSSLPNPICEGTPTTLKTAAGYKYQWFRDGELIPGATTFQYVTDIAGNYTVNVDAGSCSGSASTYKLERIQIDVTRDFSDIIFIPEGQTRVLNLTTTALSPVFQWFYNGEALAGETAPSFTISKSGDYKVIIKQTVGCNATKEFNFKVKFGLPPVDVPNLISPNGDGINDTWVLPEEFLSVPETEILILDSFGQTVLRTNKYENDWPKKNIDFKLINPIYYYIITRDGQEPKKGSITVIK
jgi:gliding motility-associated-like protein